MVCPEPRFYSFSWKLLTIDFDRNRSDEAAVRVEDLERSGVPLEKVVRGDHHSGVTQVLVDGRIADVERRRIQCPGRN